MNLWRSVVCGAMGVLLAFSGEAGAEERSSASGIPPAPSLLELARKAAFSSSPEPDVSAPPHVRSLNRGFHLKLFRTRAEVPPRPSGDGTIVARAVIEGAPARLDLPNGEYFLWLGGSADSPVAALVSADGRTTQAVDVFSRAAGPTLRWEVQSSVPASGDPLAPSVAKQTLWLQICLGARERDRGAAQQCVRVPAS